MEWPRQQTQSSNDARSIDRLARRQGMANRSGWRYHVLADTGNPRAVLRLAQAEAQGAEVGGDVAKQLRARGARSQRHNRASPEAAKIEADIDYGMSQFKKAQQRRPYHRLFRAQL